MKVLSSSWTASSLQMVALLSIIKTVVYCQTNTFTAYFADKATAFDIDYDTNKIVFATDTFELKIADVLTQVVSTTLTTTHRAAINTVALSDDGSMILTGGKDFIATVIDIAGVSIVCGWD